MDKKIVAPLLFQGTCNTAIFNAWLEQQLCPILTSKTVVVIDNAAFHKSQKTKELIHATGAALLLLPPYSPDLKPIQNTFRSIKTKRKFNNTKSIDALLQNYY